MEPLQAGRYYAKKHGWDVEVLTDTPGAGSIEAFLVSRTPWLFLFDPVGTLVYHGFGGDLEALDTWLDT